MLQDGQRSNVEKRDNGLSGGKQSKADQIGGPLSTDVYIGYEDGGICYR